MPRIRQNVSSEFRPEKEDSHLNTATPPPSTPDKGTSRLFPHINEFTKLFPIFGHYPATPAPATTTNAAKKTSENATNKKLQVIEAPVSQRRRSSHGTTLQDFLQHGMQAVKNEADNTVEKKATSEKTTVVGASSNVSKSKHPNPAVPAGTNPSKSLAPISRPVKKLGDDLATNKAPTNDVVHNEQMDDVDPDPTSKKVTASLAKRNSWHPNSKQSGETPVHIRERSADCEEYSAVETGRQLLPPVSKHYHQGSTDEGVNHSKGGSEW
jgi:hypothetical protein